MLYIYIYRLSWIYGRYTVAGSCMLMRFIKQLLTGGHHPVPLCLCLNTSAQNPSVHHHPTHSWQNMYPCQPLEKKSAGETAGQNIAHPEIQENAQQLINPLTTDISTKNLQVKLLGAINTRQFVRSLGHQLIHDFQWLYSDIYIYIISYIKPVCFYLLYFLRTFW